MGPADQSWAARGGQRAHDGVWERRMLNGLRTIAHLFNQKIGFSRLGVALSVTIIVIAAFVLYHILRDMDLDALIDALEATDWRTLIIAGLFVTAGYMTLTFYDLFALHGRSRRGALLGRCPWQLYELRGRAQCRGERFFWRRRALPNLLGLGAERRRGDENLLCRRTNLLAGQCRHAGPRNSVRPATGERHRPAAGRAQPRSCGCDLDRTSGLYRLGLGEAACYRPRRLESIAARRA